MLSQEEGTHRESQGGSVKTGAEIRVMLLQTKVHQGLMATTRRWGEAGKDQREHGSADTWVLDLIDSRTVREKFLL